MPERDEEAWLEWRRAGITATDVAKVFTNRYGGLWAVLAEKRQVEVDEPDDESLDRMKRGKDLEPVVSAMVELGTGMYLRGEETHCANAANPRHRCTIDRFALASADDPLEVAVCPVELKTYDDSAYPAFDYYEAQCQWQAYVTGWDFVLLAASAYDPIEDLVHGPRLTIVRPDPLILAGLLAAADQIDAYLASNEWPNPDGSDSAGQVITHLSDPDPSLVPADLSDIADAVEQYAAIKELTKNGGTESVLRQTLQQALGDATKGTTGEWDVGWSLPANVVDDDALLADHPEFAKTVLDRAAAEEALGKKGLDAYRRPIGSRRLTVTPTKKETA